MPTPTTPTALHFLTVAEAGRLIAARLLSPVELVQAFLARIAAVDGRLNSYITVLPERALAAARAAEAELVAGRRRGPLHGIPYGLKDNFYTRGVRTTAASRLMLDHVPEIDATAHARLEAAGAILLGKLNTCEYGTGTGAVCFDLPFPPARNPWHPDHFTGGSSTGPGAAVAAGTVMAMLRTRAATGDRTPVRLLFSSRTAADIIHRGELDRLASADDGVKIVHTLTRTQPPGWVGERGRIDRTRARAH